ncbi:hypothetical protein QVD17_38441 [Tagetes erecta]|uniref:Uncharacterized protein n=1 Tax=Tagetes erecta TaxID=13708 RepID=A0AAD8NG91_TARER|nr:hypothetical protein QVD17_38441 [Tagetes erecta]
MTMIAVANVINGSREVGIGVILDLDTDVGKSSRICILMALEDVYGTFAYHNNFRTIIRPHFRDSKYDNFQAASDAIDLVQDIKLLHLLVPNNHHRQILYLI